MDHFEGSATTRVAAPAPAVFDFVTDIDRLPTWNEAIERVTERPNSIAAGAEWVVIMHPRPLPSWRSRSRIEVLDRQRLRFGYETRTDDGDPTYAKWAWVVRPDGDGSEITVRWDVNPRTFGRKLIGARMRRRMLAHEVPASLHALRATLRSAVSDPVSDQRSDDEQHIR
jgi:uncharacterized protein YndB with AHSA1/START domain